MQLRHVSVTRVDWNNDDSTSQNFLELLDDAQNCIIIYDDGNGQDGSIYMNQKIVEAVREKVKANSNFQVRCLFNCDDPSLLFRRALSHFDQVEIKINRDPMQKMATHYKIIDGGKKAYLSKHSLGVSIRRFKRVDCSKVPERRFQRTANAILGSFNRHFDTAFGAIPQQ